MRTAYLTNQIFQGTPGNLFVTELECFGEIGFQDVHAHLENKYVLLKFQLLLCKCCYHLRKIVCGYLQNAKTSHAMQTH